MILQAFGSPPASDPNVGVVIAGCDRDLHLVAGALESIRYFMPKTPICLIFDGRSDLSQIEKVYSLSVIRRENTKSNFLRENSYGYGLTKMISFWESPFDEFLYLDSDACAWGDLMSHYSLQSFDMLTPDTGYECDETMINKWFFDLDWIRKIDPGFKPLLSGKDYFCTGTFFARKGIFDLDWYKWLLMQKQEDPRRFFLGEMGILNYMIFSSKQRDRLRTLRLNFQYVNSDSTYEGTKSNFSFQYGTPFVEGVNPIILHYAGPKPYVFNPDTYSRPMRYFRINSKQRLSPRTARIKALISVLLEDYDNFANAGWAIKQKMALRACVQKGKHALRALQGIS